MKKNYGDRIPYQNRKIAAVKPKKKIKESPPTIPEGAIRANVNIQNGCFSRTDYYMDSTRICMQCGKEFLFSAREQQYWYEILHFNMYSQAIRCKECRKQARTKRSIQNLQSAAYQKHRQNPDDPLNVLSLVESIILSLEHQLGADENFAINLARQAYRKHKKMIEFLYLEGLIHWLKDRKAKAIPLFTSFIEQAQHQERYKKIVKKAQNFLAQ